MLHNVCVFMEWALPHHKHILLQYFSLPFQNRKSWRCSEVNLSGYKMSSLHNLILLCEILSELWMKGCSVKSQWPLTPRFSLGHHWVKSWEIGVRQHPDNWKNWQPKWSRRMNTPPQGLVAFEFLNAASALMQSDSEIYGFRTRRKG